MFGKKSQMVAPMTMAKKPKKMGKPKKAKAPPKPKKPYITYKITPSNYFTLSEYEKEKKLKEFVSILGNTEKSLRIIMMTDVVTLSDGRNYIEKNVYLTSKQDFGPMLAKTKLSCSKLEKPIDLSIKKEMTNHLEMNNGAFCKVYTLHNMSKSIYPAWVESLFDLCGFVTIDVASVKPITAKRMLISHANMLNSLRGQKNLEEAALAQETKDMLEKEQTVMFNVKVTASVSASSKKELKKRCKEFERQTNWKQIRLSSIAGRQKFIFENGLIDFLFEKGSLSAFYPLEYSDLMEDNSSGGVYLGENETTGNPVIYDYGKRVNSNVTIIGESGQGKSTTVKTYIDNFMAMIRKKYGSDQKLMLSIIDPHGEYKALADYYGAKVVNLTSRDPLGLDPFKLFEFPDQAAALLAETMDMPENLKSLVISMSDGCRSIDELVTKLNTDTGPNSPDAKRAGTFFAQFVHGGLASMFKGEIIKGDRIICTMRKAQKTKINAMLISIAMQKLWKDIRDTPRHIPKLFIIDEGWFAVSMDATGNIIEDIARSGRKENVHLLFITQEPGDVLENPYGKAMMQNSATMMILGVKKGPAMKMQKVLELSDSETDEIQKLSVGQVIMRADDNRIKLRVMPTDDQLNLFSTAVKREAAKEEPAKDEKPVAKVADVPQDIEPQFDYSKLHEKPVNEQVD